MLNILAAILLFGFIVMFHEFGHFLLAKLNGIAVVEFSIGMGPRAFSFDYKGTKYSLKILPFGGSCAMADEDVDTKHPDGFFSKSVWARMSVIVAGPLFNFILAFVFGLIIVGYRGYDLPVISEVMEGTPAQEAGILPGDLILSVNGKKMPDYATMRQYLLLHPEEPLTIRYGRMENSQGEVSSDDWYHQTREYAVHTTTLKTVFNEENGAYMMGVSHLPNYYAPKNVFHLVQLGWHEVVFQSVSTIESFRLLFRGYLGKDDIGGPVRIVADIGEIVEEVRPAGILSVILTLMSLGLVLSTSLGIMNLLPIPALDGGRLAFMLIEAVRGKPLDQEKEGMVHLAGMVVLMGLMVLILFNDVRNLMFH